MVGIGESRSPAPTFQQYNMALANDGNQLYGNTALSPSTWYHLVVTKPAGSENYSFYLDGSPDGTNTWTSAPHNTTNTVLSQYNVGGGWQGLIDEVRVSNIARSAAWIKFEYANMTNANHDLSFAAEKLLLPRCPHPHPRPRNRPLHPHHKILVDIADMTRMSFKPKKNGGSFRLQLHSALKRLRILRLHPIRMTSIRELVTV